MTPVQIVATIGPRTQSPTALRLLSQNGMNIARLNGSQADLNWHARVIRRLRRIAPDVLILFDVPGKKIRTGQLAHEPDLAPGDAIVLTSEPGHDGRVKVSVTFEDLHLFVKPGEPIFATDGTIQMSVEEIRDRDIYCRVRVGGKLRSRKGVHIPHLTPRLEFLSDQDRRLIAFAAESPVDYLGLSYVEHSRDVESVRRLIGKSGARIVSKIETRGALERLQEIMEASDMLMLDRGDLSAETRLAAIALVQKDVLVEARRLSKSVIIATETLHSMIKKPFPTIAEVTDVTTAVLDGAGAIMLSGETAVGRYPLESVMHMRRIIDAAQARLFPAVENSRRVESIDLPGTPG
ncbi:pyruvate kinase [bacterium]|nr:pyruvate kinase [bacterium]